MFDTIITKIFERSRPVFPPELPAQCFEETESPVMELIRNDLYRTHTFAELRDALQPKRMSGELPLLEAEKTMEDST